MKSIAAILVELNKPLELEEIEIPKLECGQVLVKVFCSGICGSQIGEIAGIKGEDKYLPHLLGHEAMGIVLECGAGVRSVARDDKVVLHWKKSSGIEAATPTYRSRIGDINAGWVTSFNDHAVVSENRLTVVPDSLDHDVGALMGCAVTTGLGIINRDAKVHIGESVLILGAGGIGLNVVQGAAMVSAYPIIAVDLYDNKLNLARSFGASHCINSRRGDLRNQIEKVIGTAGVDVVVENTGNPEMMGFAYEMTKRQGRCILVGVPKAGDNMTLDSLPLHFGKVLTGSEGGAAVPDVDIPRYVQLYENQMLKLKELITDRHPLEQINTAIDKMKAGEVEGRCIIEMPV